VNFMYGIDQSNPRGRMARGQAQRKAMWVSFQHFLDKADSFILHYWPPDEDVAPLLALGFAPQPTELSPKARCLHGTLTPELRKLLWGPGEGEVPWCKVELVRDGQLIYYVEEHEDTAGWNGTEETLHELYKAGVEPGCCDQLCRVPAEACPSIPRDRIIGAGRRSNSQSKQHWL
jgi:hypothetical protein